MPKPEYLDVIRYNAVNDTVAPKNYFTNVFQAEFRNYPTAFRELG